MLRLRRQLLAGVLGCVLVLLSNNHIHAQEPTSQPPLADTNAPFVLPRDSKEDEARREEINERLCSSLFGCKWLLWVATRQLGSDDLEHTSRPPGKSTRSAWDLTAPQGTNVYAMADGEVIVAYCAPFVQSNGCQVAVKHDDGYISFCGHFRDEGDDNYLNGGETFVQVGDHVTRFTVIGHVGMTGQTGFSHSHCGIRKGTEADEMSWQELETQAFFDINKMNKAFYKEPDQALMETSPDVELAYADEAAQSGNSFVQTGFGFFGLEDGVKNPLESLVIPSWIFIIMFTTAFVLRLLVLSIVLYFIWRWGFDPIFRVVLRRLSREENAIHMRCKLFQRLALVALLPYLVIGGAVGWAKGFVSSPATRPFMEELISISTNGVQVDGQSGSSINVSLESITSGISPSGGTMPWLPESVEQWGSLIDDLARSQEEAEALRIIMLCESCGYAKAKSAGVGAQGLLQVMPGTADEVARQLGLPSDYDAYDPETNIKLGVKYYQNQLDAYNKDFAVAAIAYNGGPGRANTFLSSGITAIPSETQAYHKWFTGMFKERHDESSPTFEAWLAAGGKSLCQSASYQMNSSLQVQTAWR